MAEIRPMTFEELQQQIAWARAEGWEPGQDDASLFWQLDPKGFLALEHEGNFIGGGAIIRHSAQFGFMGLFLVDRLWRGKGFGTKLWYTRRDRLLQRLGEGATIGLDGVYEMVPFYEKGGFQQYSFHRRFMLPPPATTTEPSESIVELSTIPFETISAFDRGCFPAPRGAFLQRWLTQPTAIAHGYVDADGLRGFGVLRPGTTGWRLAPLFADDPEIANALFQHFRTLQGDRPVYLDVPDNNPDAQAMVRRYGMKEVFGCVRMYLGPEPKLDHHRIYGVTTFEVG